MWMWFSVDQPDGDSARLAPSETVARSCRDSRLRRAKGREQVDPERNWYEHGVDCMLSVPNRITLHLRSRTQLATSVCIRIFTVYLIAMIRSFHIRLHIRIIFCIMRVVSKYLVSGCSPILVFLLCDGYS